MANFPKTAEIRVTARTAAGVWCELTYADPAATYTLPVKAGQGVRASSFSVVKTAFDGSPTCKVGDAAVRAPAWPPWGAATGACGRARAHHCAARVAWAWTWRANYALRDPARGPQAGRSRLSQRSRQPLKSTAGSGLLTK